MWSGVEIERQLLENQGSKPTIQQPTTKSYSHGQPMSNPGWEIAGYENGKEILPGDA
jgi:hypothetical protein